MSGSFGAGFFTLALMAVHAWLAGLLGLVTVGTTWSLAPLLGLVTYVGLTVVVPRWFDLVPAEA